MAAPDFFRLYKPTEDHMRETLAAAASDIERDLLKLAGRRGTGATLEAAQLRLILKEIHDYNNGIFKDIFLTMRGGLRAVIEGAWFGKTQIDTYLRRNGLALPGLATSFKAQAKRGFDNVIAKGINNIPLSRQVYATKALANGWVDRKVRSALIRQVSAAQLAREVREFIDPDVKGGVSYAAIRLARTELNNAFHTNALRRYEEPWATGCRWRLSARHKAHQVRGLPEICEQYANVELGHGTGVFPVADTPALPHPQCRCTISQEVVSEDAFIDGLLAGEYDDYLDGEIPRPASAAAAERIVLNEKPSKSEARNPLIKKILPGSNR